MSPRHALTLSFAAILPLSLAAAVSAQTPAPLPVAPAASPATTASPAPAASPNPELPVHLVPNIGAGAEFYFSPDNTHLIGDAKRAGDASYHVYTLKLDGTDIKRINDKGDDACTYYFPDGKHIIWTSTRDHPEFAKDNYSDPTAYPKGAELYVSDLDGHHVKRLTNNDAYDAEVSVASSGTWILFGSERSGKMELWKAGIDGSNPVQITHLDGWEPGGPFLFRDDRTIIFRAWRSADAAAKKSPLPMTLFTIDADGTNLHALTHDEATNWSPFPAPDGHHYVFVKLIAPHQYQIYLGDLKSDKQVRLTYSPGFDGYPSISPDGHWLAFTSTRGAAPGTHVTGIYLMDISSLHIGPQ